MTTFLQLRSATSGAPFVGTNQDDTVLWDTVARAWYVGPGGGGGAVSSVFGRTGAVVAVTGDYDGDQVDNVSGVPGASLSDALDYLLANAGAVSSVFGRVGIVVAASGDYDSDQVDNVSGVSGASVSDALDTLAAAAAAGVSSFNTRSGAVTAATNDYSSTQIQNLSGVPGSSTTAALNALGPALKQGAALTDASVTLTPTNVSDYRGADNLLTANRNNTIDPAGLNATQAVTIDLGQQTFTLDITNGGLAGGVIFTFLGDSRRRRATFQKDVLGNVYCAGSEYIEALS